MATETLYHAMRYLFEQYEAARPKDKGDLQDAYQLIYARWNELIS